MATYIILSRLAHDAMGDPSEFRGLADDVSSRIKRGCPGVRWKDSYGTLGRFDVVDVVEADDPHEVERAALIIRCYGHAETETLLATPWDAFKQALSGGG